MLRWTEFAEKITTRGVYQIWHCNVASLETKSLEAPKKGIDLIRKLGRIWRNICTVKQNSAKVGYSAFSTVGV